MPTLTTMQFPAAATPAAGAVFGLVTAPAEAAETVVAAGRAVLTGPCLAVRPVRRVGGRLGQPRISVENQLVISCRTTAGARRAVPRRGAASRPPAAGPRPQPGGCSGLRAAATRSRRPRPGR